MLITYPTPDFSLSGASPPWDDPGHKDYNECLYTYFERLWQLFDELHSAKPELFIDYTFETMVGVQLIDYAMLKHAEGNWKNCILANFWRLA